MLRMLRGVSFFVLNSLCQRVRSLFQNVIGLLSRLRKPDAPGDEPGAPGDEPGAGRVREILGGEPDLLVQGVYCLHRPENGVVHKYDVVFIHGLRVGSGGSQWVTTWTTRDGTRCWPKMWLPESFPNARVLALSYDSAAIDWNGAPMTLWDNAINCVNTLLLPQVGLGARPYVLVGHSMGGLLAKELLLRANDAHNRDQNPGLRENCRGIAFYGVPHLGAEAAELLTFVDGLFHSADVHVRTELTLFGTECFRRNVNFKPHERDYPAQNFIETRTTYGVMVVPPAIAGFNAGADNMILVPNADHFNVCRPERATDLSYAMFVNFLAKRLAQENINVVQQPQDNMAVLQEDMLF